MKGSKLGRKTRRKKNDIVEPSIALKDLDFDQELKKLKVDTDVKDALIKQIEIDVRLF